jgi:arylsulfatase A-like enzyme
MKILSIILTTHLLLTAVICAAVTPERPNIIIVFTDDWGYGDLGVHGTLNDVATPHLDNLSRQGILFTDGYITAPQCSPSRAGLLTGRYQQRFGFDTIPDGPLPREETTLADRLRAAGYVTGMVGKWHLEPNPTCLKWARQNCPEAIENGRVHVDQEVVLPYYPQSRGFDEFFCGAMSPYWSNFDLDGRDLKAEGERVADPRFRVDVQTEAGLAFVRRQADKPFFLYLAYFAPHVPLEAPKKYLDRFPGEMPERRRTGLAMMSAVDDGVGRIMRLLQEKGISQDTLLVFTCDNGAPLGAQQGEPMADILPVGKRGPAWDGSRNDPLTGEKGMLAEGGIRVPMIWSWPARLPTGAVCREPMISLDITASALAAAGLPSDPAMDGVNLLPRLAGETERPPDRDLFWRFWNQAAVRSGDWKFICAGAEREMLFNLREDKEEKRNLIGQYPDVASKLKRKLEKWTNQLKPAGLPIWPLNGQEQGWYRYYFSDTTAADAPARRRHA